MALGQQADMTDLSAATEPPGPSSGAADLAITLGQVSLDSSPVLTPKPAKFTRKFSLRELEIQQTIGEAFGVRVWLCDGPERPTVMHSLA